MTKNSQIPIPKHRPIQIRLQQSKHVQLHVLYQIPHPPLTIPPRVVNPEVDGPDACVEESSTCVRSGWCRRR